MEKIIKRNGYVYLVEGELGFETYFNLGKDPDDPMWKEELEINDNGKPKKRKSIKKEQP